MNQSKNGRHNETILGNLFLHVIGGQQLTWPPTNTPQAQQAHLKEEESKVESTKEAEPSLTAEDVYKLEMGFALVIEEMIKAKKPLIGHNCMYDWLYVYN